jgi:hypothetical protein
MSLSDRVVLIAGCGVCALQSQGALAPEEGQPNEPELLDPVGPTAL